MCGRYAAYRRKRDYARRFGFPDAGDQLQHTGDTIPKYNVHPGLCSWVIRTESWGKPAFASLWWGLLPYWAKDPKIHRPANARAETVHEKPMFRDPFRARRCLVPADAYFEWKTTPAGKLPYCFRMADDQPFFFAGLWDNWKRPDVESIPSYTLLTTEPNELAATVHDRMPVIIRPEHYERWIDPQLQDVDEIRAMVTTYPAEEMVAWPVSKRVNDPKNEGPELLEKVL